MSDYYFSTGMLRGQMADTLSENEEQFVFVLSQALSRISADDVIELGELSDEADRDLVIANLRMIADATEGGDIT